MNIKSFFTSILAFFKKAPAVDTTVLADQVARGAQNAANTALAATTLAAAVSGKDIPGAVAAAVVVAQTVATDVADVKADIDAGKAK